MEYAAAIKSDIVDTETLNAIMSKASPAAQQFANTKDVTSESIAEFIAQQKMAEVAIIAQKHLLQIFVQY